MDVDKLIAKLTIMKKEEPDKFHNFINRLKIEKPKIYDKIKLVFEKDIKSRGVDFGEEPLNIKISQEEDKKYTWMIVLIIFALILLFLGVIYFLSL